MKINYKFLSIFMVIFMLEIYIAMFIHDKIIRPFIGDVLVVAVVYFFIRSFIKKAKYLIVYVFIFACLIEIGQYFDLISLLHLEHFKAARIILGSTFDFNDILCYLIGSIALFVYEIIENKRLNKID